MAQSLEIVSRAVYVPDAHGRFVDRYALGAVLDFIQRNHVDQVIHLGDWLDNNPVSRHIEHSPRLKEGERLLDEYRYTEKHIITPLEQAMRVKNRKAKLVMHEGNHESWVSKWLNKHPEIEGMVEPENYFRFAERGIKYVYSDSRGELYKNGHLYSLHGHFVSKNHAERHVSDYGVNVVYGHTHKVVQTPKVLRGKNKTLMATSLGCICKYDLPYMRGKPTDWQHAFGVYERLSNGFHNLYPVLIFNGSAAFGGNVYSYRRT
jgi:predicted phosphodiesterase